MSTRLHALGFPEHWTPELLALIETLAATKSRLVGAAKGNYRVWRSANGAELWFHYPRRNPRFADRKSASGDANSPTNLRPVSVTPFHRGLSSCPIKVGRYLTLERSNPLEGSCMASAHRPQ